MLLRQTAICAAVCVLLSAAETAHHGMAPEDYYAIRNATDPHLSPDGRLVAYTLRTVDQKRNRYASSIWLTRADGSGEAWQFTTGEGGSSPRWSPDGKTLAFLSVRTVADAAPGVAARAQVYALSMAGGEAVRLTAFPEGVSEFAWSPDGKRLACITRTTPGKPEAAPDFRHYRSPIYKFDRAGWYDDKRAHLWIFDLETRAERQITHDPNRDDSQPRWSPDGAKIAFVSQDIGQYPGLGGSISVIAASGGAPVVISNQNGSAGSPHWSPDGTKIAYVASPNDTDDARIWLASPAGGTSQLASRTLDVIPTEVDWGADGDTLLFNAWSRGEQQLFRLALSSGTIAPITSGNIVIRDSEIDASRNLMVYVESAASRFSNIYISNLAGRDARQLTNSNRELSQRVTLQDIERLRYPAADDLTVEGFFMKPDGWQAGKSYPMILYIHGGPGGMWDAGFYHDFQTLTARGWAVLFINPRGSSGYGEKFQRAVEKQWGGKAYDDLMRGVDYALQKYPWVDRNRLGVRGGSFGGFMTNWIVGHTTRFKAAVTASSISDFISLEGTRDMAYSHAKDFGGDLFENFDFYWNQSPLKYAKDVKTPILVMHGDADGRVPIEQGEQWFRALQHFGVPSEFVVFPRENHGIATEPRHHVEVLQWQIYWFERYLNGNTAWPEPQ